MNLFNTSRLSIRYFTKKDLLDFFDMVGNPNVMRYIKQPLNFEESKLELEKFINFYESKETYFKIWAVEETKSEQVIGLCGVYINDRSEYEIAYRLRESFWSKGFGSEIAKGLLQYCFQEIGIEKLTAYVIKGNKGSIKILEKEMSFDKEFFSDKQKVVERKYHLTKKSWLKRIGNS